MAPRPDFRPSRLTDQIFMNNSLRIFLVFFCLTGLSAISLYMAAKHFCISIAFLVSCDPRDEIIFLCGAAFPFIAFPVAAILCAVNLSEKTVRKKFLSAFLAPHRQFWQLRLMSRYTSILMSTFKLAPTTMPCERGLAHFKRKSKEHLSKSKSLG